MKAATGHGWPLINFKNLAKNLVINGAYRQPTSLSVSYFGIPKRRTPSETTIVLSGQLVP